ncbi:toxin secretion, membrane fusion protein [Psychrosphaera saromensis]|uniref:Toxin secretion protein n=1 Tax=Psychrosphaera saromensis TaxID=716813 RepID=A0A2S7UTL0_9GAMM|nr:HlyD family efflux transporter periplasmic adaptor subunit [Psychrosphaera saromensis]PQJ53316.1 toxin secretion protein [Psychrosphaera saromensis]GHB66461.1 toxin secretion, membrane fusion protein [Psychrosphaera saromensis]GLQ14914.1 toxin secretion, membrane fusion protein [Psychrosphaera saromensis]
MSLFRKEAVAQQSERLTGEIILAQPLSIKLTVGTLVAITATIVLFIFTAEYSRKETVRGFLIPIKGVVKSVATQGGVVDKLWVKEGDKVIKGQPLVSIIIQKKNATGIDLSDQLIEQVERQKLMLSDEISQHNTLQLQEVKHLKQRYLALKNEQGALTNQLTLADEKLTLLLAQQKYFNTLSKNGHLSKFEKDTQEQELLGAKQEKQNINRLLIQQQNELTQVRFNIENIPQQYALKINNLKRQQSEFSSQIAQISNGHKYTITASQGGVVSGIQVFEGENLTQAKSILHILPEDSELIAELLLPTRSAGFIEEGNNTRLRFDAFPYQRFGFIQSQIVQIDQTLITPNERQMPIALQEPVYRLRAKLNQQQIQAFGKEFDLKSGMLFDADIMLEQRTLIEWLLEPLYSLKGRVG